MGSSPKFKVGDYTTLRVSNLNRYKKITKVTEHYYEYDVFSKDTNNYIKSNRWDFNHYDSTDIYYYKKVLNNPITLELYKDEIIREENGYLLIKA